ncbi:hypothetical protein WJX72_005198 [[Myrmecia] bisecta]|uniref:Uncharacterized protein n=1 Tax=[Myrmecia] bisecta TaxID=41462 RepID=A0AAW1Q791_9CHLO
MASEAKSRAANPLLATTGAAILGITRFVTRGERRWHIGASLESSWPLLSTSWEAQLVHCFAIASLLQGFAWLPAGRPPGLYCRGVALQNEQAVAALYLANGEFLTAVPVQKRKGAKTAKQLTAKQATAVAKLPLTAELERLVAIFGALNAVYGFLLRQHIQATWHTVREALRSLPGGSSAQLEDIKLMAELCPDVVHLRAQEMLISPVRTMQQRAAVAAAAQAAAQAVPASPQTGTVAQEPSTTANQSASPTSSAATAAGELPAGVVGHPSVEASGFGLARDGDVIEFRTPTASPIRVNTANPLELFTDGSGTILEGECNRYVIEIVDPGRRKAPATASLSTLGGQDLDGGLTDEAGLLSGSLGASGEPLKQQTDRGAKNAMQRRARAFRQALVQARPPQIMRKHQPCTDCTPMDTNQFLDHLRSLPWYCGQAVHCEQIAARKAKLGLPQYQLSPPVQQALQKRGVDKLFSHQAQAVDAIMSGQHVVVSTSTASGKSLCYNIPILEALAADRHACAIYMFPTKALAQDQMRALRELCQLAFGPNGPHVDVYDGDTLKADRGEIRERAQLLITNPDMLHLSILPVHRTFARILANLKYVVVDEGHAYRGVFGCHTALVLRRLRRLCERQYNSLPRFVVTSATVANPQHHVQDLLGVPGVRVVSEDGSPHGPKCFVLWNPPLTAGQEALNSKGGKGMLSNTEMRARGRKMGKRAEQEFVRSEVREANQDRGRGAKLGPQSADALDEAAWMSTVRAGRRRGAVVQTASAALAAAKAVAGQQPGAAGDAALDPEAAAVAGQGPHTGSDMASGSSRAPAKLDPAAVQRAAAAVAAAVVPRSKGVLTYSAQDLEHRHDDAIQVRPLIRRQATHGRYDKPPDPRIKHRGAQPVEPPKPANPGASGGQWIDPGPKREAWKNPAADPQVMDVQKRLPGTNWRERYGAAGTAGEQRRSSPIVELSMLLAECIQHGLRTIAFCMTRKLCELVTAYTREMLKSTAPHLAKSISVYRAGYSPQERREIERALFNGELWAVAATNALELGVDVGSLDVTLHLGFPGSVASLWQQAGRAGRREQPSMSIYIAFDGPMDQYFMTHPDKLFSRSIENAQVDPQNAQLLGQHLTCAAAECPLLPDEDQRFFGPTLPTIASGLTTEGLLARHPQTMHTNALHYIGPRSNPAAGISLRAIDPERYAIVNEAAGGEVMEEIEESKAFYEVYDGAVYMFQGRTYLCKKLDLASKVAVVRPADLKYYTKTRDFCDVHVTGDKALYPAKEGNSQYPETTAAHAPADVTVRWLGFHRIWQGSGEVFDTVDLFLPDVQYSTQAAYIRVPASARQRVQQAGLPFRDGLHAASHALLNVLPLYMMCNPHDMGTECDNPYDTRFRPERLLLYDKHPGGIGLAAQACPLFGELMQKALELLHNCPCQSDSGCPSCIQHTDCGEYNAVLHKGAGKIVLECTLQAEDEYRERRALQEAAAAAGNDAPPDFALVERTGGDVDGLMNNLAVPDYD